ncbi:MAG: hypothetical protein AAFQ51_04340 [Pseudomonadota bacterium]
MAAPEVYSRLIRLLRIALPLIAITLMSTMFLFSDRDSEFGDDFFEEIAREPAVEAGVLAPRFSGLSDKEEPFVLNARFARPLPNDPTRYEMEEITGAFDRFDGEEIAFTAEGGGYDEMEQILTLSGEITVESTDGYALRTRDAEAKLSESALLLPNGVSIDTPDGTITADRMRAERRGDAETTPETYMIWFEGNVRVRIVPDASADNE